MSKYIGFTIIELLVSIAILSSLVSIGVPSINEFLVRMRVDSEISLLHRMLLLARNNAVNNELYVTLCPLTSQLKCSSNWQGEVSVFSDINKNRIYEPNAGDFLIKTKPAIPDGDKLQYGKNRIALIYGPTGRLAIWGGNATFKYCPENHDDKSRGLVVSVSGRVYQTAYDDKYSQDTNRSGKTLLCS